MKCIAIDIGATSGRVMTVTYDGGLFSYKENKRFINRIYGDHGTLRWDFSLLMDNIISGIRQALSEEKDIESIGIDTWAVDYGMIDENGNLICDPLCYRDTHSFEGQKELQQKIPFADIYSITGIQDLHFNTIYQLYTHREELKKANKILLIPDLIAYKLTGVMKAERTNLSTTSLFDPRTNTLSDLLLGKIEVSKDIFPELILPGQTYGRLSKDIFPELEKDIDVIAVATHDTASAVLGADGEKGFTFLSSGTWSLLGAELDKVIISKDSLKENFTNELGYDNTVRFLKNTMGMFIANEVRKNFYDLEEPIETKDITSLVMNAGNIESIIDPDNPCFETPGDMIHKIDSYLKRTGQKGLEGRGEYLKVIYQSMALSYRRIIDSLERIIGERPTKIIVVGGGNQAEMMNRYLSDSTNLIVETGPIEATVLGNSLAQFIAKKAIRNKEEGREAIKRSITKKVYYPRGQDIWEERYKKYLDLRLNK